MVFSFIGFRARDLIEHPFERLALLIGSDLARRLYAALVLLRVIRLGRGVTWHASMIALPRRRHDLRREPANRIFSPRTS